MTTVGCSISKITRFVAFPGVSNLGRQPVDPLYVQSLTPSNNRVHAVAIRRPQTNRSRTNSQFTDLNPIENHNATLLLSPNCCHIFLKTLPRNRLLCNYSL